MQTVSGNVAWNTMTFAMQIANVTGAQGVGYDSLDIVGQLTITGGATIDVNLDSMGSQAANFDGLTPFDLILMSTNTTIAGFDTATFNVNASNFVNPYGGVFSVALSLDQTDLYLHYATAVSEPGSLALGASASLAMAWRARRRRRSGS